MGGLGCPADAVRMAYRAGKDAPMDADQGARQGQGGMELHDARADVLELLRQSQGQIRQEEALRIVSDEFPRWFCWIVYRVYGGPVYCARLHEDHKKVINESSAYWLAVALQEHEATSR